MARKVRDYKPIEFRQLCMVVKMLLQQEPTIDDAEWKARTRDHLQRLGFDGPDPEQLSRAMTQVEQALKQTIGERRTIPAPAPPKAPQPPPPESKQRTSRPAGWDIVVALMAKLTKGSAVSVASSQPEAPRELLSLTEEQALDEFWRQARMGCDKLALLRAFAEVAIVRPADWDYLDVRRHANDHTLRIDGCFVCCDKERTAHWHHVIQIQHGGSNYLRNRVALCGPCHSEIHPWMQPEPRMVGGWTHIGGMTAEAAAALQAKRDRELA